MDTDRRHLFDHRSLEFALHFLPYALEPVGRHWAVLNRDYKPLGVTTLVDYEDYAVRLYGVNARVSVDGTCTPGERIFLYDAYDHPRENWAGYASRLKHFAAMEVASAGRCSAAALFLPYCLKPCGDGWVVLNRFYKPISRAPWPRDWVDYATYAEPLPGLTHLQAPATWLYTDATTPTRSACAWREYAAKLELLATLRVWSYPDEPGEIAEVVPWT